MLYKLIQLEQYEISDDPIELNDYSSGSYALYKAINTHHLVFIFFRPDQRRETEPRCDYILVSKDDQCIPSRFIELKGDNQPRKERCCKTEWDHAFHQLFCTYQGYETYIDTQIEKIIFILSTSIEEQRIAAKFKKYRWYRMLQEVACGEIKVLYRNDYDTI